ncbi:tetratricopeptide repeat protein [Sporomusa aerivorans]|uniref:tetratricopeptide repeat protein n=1 Tax=Sporomusa aerivorans TaxID=204936 RepID=UPI00352AD42B
MSYDIETRKIFNEAQHYYAMGRYEKALAKFDQLLSIHPNDNDVLYMRANSLFGLNRYDEAVDCCSQALANGFFAADCHYLLGKIFMETNRYVEAEEHFLEALRDNPERADIMATYGYLMLKTGHDKKARRLIENALSIDPSDEVVLQYHFYYHLAKNQRDDQVEALRRYLQTSDSEVRKLIQMGVMEYSSGNYKAARENFRQAYLLDPTDEHILSILKDLERSSSIFYFPQRMIERIGGPAVLWIGMVVFFLILQGLGFSKAIGIISVIYIVLCAYTWIMPLIYKAIQKLRENS